jgi:hypothetical protein
MVDLFDFCRDLDPNEPKTDQDFIEELKSFLIVEKHKTRVEELNER